MLMSFIHLRHEPMRFLVAKPLRDASGTSGVEMPLA